MNVWCNKHFKIFRPTFTCHQCNILRGLIFLFENNKNNAGQPTIFLLLVACPELLSLLHKTTSWRWCEQALNWFTFEGYRYSILLTANFLNHENLTGSNCHRNVSL